jgi:hypothetical protein
MEGHYMVIMIFSRFFVELGDVGREFDRDGRP